MRLYDTSSSVAFSCQRILSRGVSAFLPTSHGPLVLKLAETVPWHNTKSHASFWMLTLRQSTAMLTIVYFTQNYSKNYIVSYT